MAPGLGHMVELVFFKVKAAHQRANRSVPGVHGDKGALDFGQLGDFPGILGPFDDPDHRTRTDLDVRPCLVSQSRLRRPQALAGNDHFFVVQAQGNNALRIGFQHHRRHDVAIVGAVGQGVVNRVVDFPGVGRQVDEPFGTAVNLPAFVIHDALAQRLVGHRLVGGLQGCVDIQAAGVGFLAILVEHQLAHGFRHMFGMHPACIASRADVKLLFAGCLGLLGGDETVLRHPFDDVKLARPGPAGVGNRVVGRRRLGQPGEHGGLRNAHILQGQAEIGFRGSGKAIRAIAQENLIHVDFKNLIFCQGMLEFEGQQNFVDLAGVAFFRRQVNIAGDLHRDGGGALAFCPAQVGQRRPCHTQVIDPAMREKAGVLDGEHRVLHDLRNLVNRHEPAALFAELANDHTVGGVDSQRLLGPVV